MTGPIASSLCWHVLVRRSCASPDLFHSMDRKTATEVARRVAPNSGPWQPHCLRREAAARSFRRLEPIRNPFMQDIDYALFSSATGPYGPGVDYRVEVFNADGKSLSVEEIWPEPMDWEARVAALERQITADREMAYASLPEPCPQRSSPIPWWQRLFFTQPLTSQEP